MRSLTREEARERADLVTVTAMTVDLDLDQGDERFGSRTVLEFAARTPGTATWVELAAHEVHSARLNGQALDVSTVADGRLPLPDLVAANVLEVRATMSYSHDGQGLHRSVDPADGRHYVFGHLFLDAAPRVFACFDQPDLKAPYTVSVTAPEGWSVYANGDGTQDGRRWTFTTTPPLATYFVTVCAGPWVSVRAEHDGIPLGVHARVSLEPALKEHAEDILDVTRRSFDHYHRLFGIRYPFGSYEQVFAPEFNAGAMENPGCVVHRDEYLYRGAVTHDQLLVRANTVAHEMAHMWFGDLVTMRWWDDLWLNESFAEYMASRTLSEAVPEYADAWVNFGIARKLWGYAADAAPSTHPIAGAPAPDGLTALANFDGISYAKGASAIRQLIAYIGDEAFLTGLRDYLGGHAFGNGELADFLAAMGRASGQDLTPWSEAWLRTCGADTLRVDDQGRLHRAAPVGHPATRPHTFDLAVYADGAETFRTPVTLAGHVDAVGVAGLAAPEQAVVLPNAGDLTWASVVLDDASLAALPAELPRIADPLARAVAWTSVLRGVRTAAVDPRRALDLFTAAWPAETDANLLWRVSLEVIDVVVGRYLPEGERDGAVARVAGAAFRLLGAAAPGSGAALAAARVLARTTDDEDRLRTWAAGEHLPAGLEGDTDFRWVVLRALAGHGLLVSRDLEDAREADDTLTGRLACLTARAALPDPGSKGWAWYELTENRARTNYETIALAKGMWSSAPSEELRPYATAFFDALPRMSGWLGEDALSYLAFWAYPRFLADEQMLDLAAAAAARTDLSPGVRREFVDGAFDLQQVSVSRATFG